MPSLLIIFGNLDSLARNPTRFLRARACFCAASKRYIFGRPVRKGACWEASIGAICKFGLVAVLLVTTAVQRPLLAQQPDAAPSQDAPATYLACVSKANAVHDAAHAAECQRLADMTARNRADCADTLKLPPAYCNASYPPRDGSANCVLPEQVATVIDAALEQARYRCLRENKSASQ